MQLIPAIFNPFSSLQVISYCCPWAQLSLHLLPPHPPPPSLHRLLWAAHSLIPQCTDSLSCLWRQTLQWMISGDGGSEKWLLSGERGFFVESAVLIQVVGIAFYSAPGSFCWLKKILITYPHNLVLCCPFCRWATLRVMCCRPWRKVIAASITQIISYFLPMHFIVNYKCYIKSGSACCADSFSIEKNMIFN